MKKIISILLVSFLAASLFAEQPFFLQNWIIPDDFVWSDNKKIPEIPNTKFWQRMDPKYDDSYIEINSKKSNIDFPPYFLENNLIGWDKTYAEVIEAFKDNDLFFTYEFIYPIAHINKLADGIEFLDIIKIVCRQNNYFEVELYFPHSKTQEERNAKTPGYCYIFYYKDGLPDSRAPKPPVEMFEENYRRLWDKNSLEEKQIIALSYFRSIGYNFAPAKYDCTLMINNSNADPAAFLKSNYKISNKDDLIDYLNNHMQKTIFPEYETYKQDIASNPEKDIIEIGAKKNYTISEISRLFFVADRGEAIGKNGVDLYEYSGHLFLLRLATGAGIITKEESLEYGMPIVKKILKQYSSFKDFAAHTAAVYSYVGVASAYFLDWPVQVIKDYYNAEKYFVIEEIQFDGSEADKPLLFDDAYYKPVEDAYWWFKVQTEYRNKDGKELSSVKFVQFLYEDVPCLDKLISEIKPKKYEATSGTDASKFFTTNYKQIWNKLPETEKYAIAFSNNLFELNHQYHLDFDNKVKLSDNSSNSKELLKDSWSIESYEALIEMFNSLEEYGHSGAYKALADLLEKYPDKTPAQIATAENLSITDTTRLHFVYDTRDILGEHGIEAWDEGREITILRWGISSDYISSDEAKELIEPVIKRIRENYVSYEDFISHYIMGRQFYALFDGNYENLGERAKGASFSARAYIPFDELKFTSENADAENPMSYSDCIFTPSEDFLKWEKIMALYRQKASLETIDQLAELEKEYPEYEKLLFYWHISLLNYFGQYSELIDFTEKNMSYLETLPKDGEVYANSIYFYIQALNTLFNPVKALSVYNQQPEVLQGNFYYYDQYAYANYLLINFSTTQKEMDSYKQIAAAAYKLLKQYNYDIGKRLEGWLQFIEGKRSEELPPLENISEESRDYAKKMLDYLDNLLNINQPDKVIALYQSLPENLQRDERFYYDYGLANYLMSYRCTTIIEKDIFNSRAADIFNRLQSHGFLLDSSINYWLSSQ